MTKGISDFKDFGINLNAQPVNGMTHLTFSITYKAFSFNFTVALVAKMWAKKVAIKEVINSIYSCCSDS